MTAAIIILVFLCAFPVASLVILVRLVLKAPSGYEDSGGYHER